MQAFTIDSNLDGWLINSWYVSVGGKNGNGQAKAGKNIIQGAKSTDAQNIAGKAKYAKETAN